MSSLCGLNKTGNLNVFQDDLLINLVIEQMINDPDPELGGAVQLMGILRLLIDPENMIATALVKFSHLFYTCNSN